MSLTDLERVIRMANVKGTKISDKIAFVSVHYGEAAVKRVLDSMDEKDQMVLKIVLDSNWYPFELYERLVRAICVVAAGNDESVYTTMGHYSALQAFTTTYRAFRGKSPIDFLKNVVPMHELRNSPSRIEVSSPSDCHCTLKIVEPRSTIEICKVMKAFLERSVELSGGSGIKVGETVCSGRGAEYCQFEVKWQATEGKTSKATQQKAET